MIITLEQLKQLDACPSQLDLFEKKFGTSVELTVEVCLTHAQDFEWNWAAKKLLSEEKLRIYDEIVAQAWKVYDEIRVPAWKVYFETIDRADKVYDEIMAQAENAYDEIVAQADKVYDETIDRAEKVYEEIVAQARKVYKETKAKTFAELICQNFEDQKWWLCW